ncbi:MAG: ferritin [Desulfobulbaceae bacterium]|nr:MAG: ferritin [Desulfobulbaceae bacterium]
MIDQKLCDALNKQINAEMFSSYLYLSMAAWFETKSLSGFANWMRVQSEEEMFHAMKMFDYVNERGGRVILDTIEKPEAEWDSPLAVIEAVLKHEELVTRLINDLVDVSMEIRDHAGTYFLQWYVEEQVEEEANVGTLLERMRMIADDSAGMFALDMEMAKRTFTPPSSE